MVKKLLFILGGIIALVIIAAIAAVMLVDVNSYKPKIEAAALEATGFELKINGKIGISLFPIGVSADDIHISNKQGQIVGLKKLTIGVELLPLLRKEIKVSSCDLVNPVISIVKDTNGKFNFEETEKIPAPKKDQDRKGAAAAGAAFSVGALNLSDGSLVYLDKKSGDRSELKGFNLSIKNFAAGAPGDDMVKHMSFTGSFDCKEVLQKKLKIDNIKASIKANNGVFEVTPISMEAFGGKGEGDSRIDMAAATWGYKKDFKLSKFSFEKITESFGQKKSIGGEGNMVLAVTAHGREMNQIMGSLNGSFSIKGDNLILYTMDLDKKLTALESPGKFTLNSLSSLDLSSVVGLDSLLGAGAAANAKGEQGVIKKLVSDWTIRNGVADATDVAVATLKHRVAVKGKLNLVSERYENLVLAVIDEKGCSKFKQTLNGPFKKPKIDTLDMVKTLTTAVQKYGGLFGLKQPQQQPAQEAKCDNFYSGSVQAPK
jgi:AsmA protein